MQTFIALYRGRTIGEARMVAVSADPTLVSHVVHCLVEAPYEPGDDPVVSAIDHGRVTALRLLRKEHSDAKG